jgi:virginiamycin A acetyltransferase
MQRTLINILPKFLLKSYNKISNKYKFRRNLTSLGSEVSILNSVLATSIKIGSKARVVNSKLGIENEISEGVIVLNSTMLGNVIVGQKSVINNSVLGERVNIDSNSHVIDCVFKNNIIIGDGSYLINSELESFTKVYRMTSLGDSKIGMYTYVGENSSVSMTRIGKFCSIGPNLRSGRGIHPIYSLSTHPMFYSTRKQNGITLSKIDKILERKQINIGSDVFIGMNVIILDGITIGDGAIIAAGSVVSKDIPPYAIAAGSPIQILKYRYSEGIVKNLLDIRWWDWDSDEIKEVEKHFNDVEGFVNKFKRG